MPAKKIPNFAGTRRSDGDADKFLFRQAGLQKTKIRLFIRRREEIKAAQQMNERYWNKKAQRVAQTVLNMKRK